MDLNISSKLKIKVMDVYKKFQNLPMPEFEVINCEKCNTKTVDDLTDGIIESMPARVYCKCFNCGHTNDQTRQLTTEQYYYYCDVLRKRNVEYKTLKLSKPDYDELKEFLTELTDSNTRNSLSYNKAKAEKFLKVINLLN